MPKGIASRGIGSRGGIGGRQIANRYGLTNAPEAGNFLKPSATFTPPKAGYWKFILWGGGGNGSPTASGASGAYCEKTAFLTPATPVAIAIGANEQASTVTLPNGVVVTAGGASGATPGVASNGDVNLNGSAGTSGNTAGPAGAGTGGGAGGAGVSGGTGDAAGGAGAPANLPYRGSPGAAGRNATGSSQPDPSPGAGGGQDTAAGGVILLGGRGDVRAVFLHE